MTMRKTIENWYITGDLHGSLDRFAPGRFSARNPENTGIICLGDCGFNYYLNEQDVKTKLIASHLGYTFYCVRGNHEARPEDIAGMELSYDENVGGNIYYEPLYPNIRYLLDGGFYKINDKNILVIGGAYSVDKLHRLARGWRWFSNEQLNAEERSHISDCVADYINDGGHIDLVLTHTAPISCEPTELFLSFIDQSTVEKDMEYWLEDIKFLLSKPYMWLFGHYHADVVMNDNTVLLFNKIVDFNTIEDFSNPYVELPDGFKVSHNYAYARETRGLPLL